jgi:hypothetical protein
VLSVIPKELKSKLFRAVLQQASETTTWDDIRQKLVVDQQGPPPLWEQAVCRLNRGRSTATVEADGTVTISVSTTSGWPGLLPRLRTGRTAKGIYWSAPSLTMTSRQGRRTRTREPTNCRERAVQTQGDFGRKSLAAPRTEPDAARTGVQKIGCLP